LAVWQAALLTYELLGGEKKKDGEVKRSFKPVNGRGIISYFDSISRGLIVVARIDYLGVA
jgi:hypothetical protein